MIEIAISDLIAIGISGIAMGISIANIAWMIAICELGKGVTNEE